MGWRVLDFGAGTGATVKAAFESAFKAAGAPTNAALFEVRDTGSLQFYFSPGAAILFESTLKTLDTRRGEAPPPGARLVVGSPETWQAR